MTFPPIPGSYALIFHLPTPLLSVCVGRLGTFDFAPGTWIYCGSAHGPGGLRARIRRHLRLHKRVHWHIDTLTIRSRPTAVLVATEADPEARLECRWTQHLLQAGMTAPIHGFGNSDCASGCPAHLLYFPEEISAPSLSATLQEHGFELATWTGHPLPR